MMIAPMTVEQILAAAQHLSVRDKVRLIARLTPEIEQALDIASPRPPDVTGQPLSADASPALSVLDVAGSWAGDDFEDCLAIVYATRQPVGEDEDADLSA